MQNYIDVLKKVGKSPLVLADRILVLPYGCRVLGVFPKEDVNGLWVNPALDSLATAKEFFAGSQWLNSGGDRTWLSPEVEIHIEDINRPQDTYKVPHSMDPAGYEIVSCDGREAVLETRIKTRFFRSNCDVDVLLRKTIKALDKPELDLPEGILSAGYMQECTLSADNLHPDVRPAIWNLAQVPGCGEIIMPVKENSSPTPFFGKPEFQLSDRRVIAAIPATDESYKFSIKADDSLGVMVYLNLSARNPFLVARWFDVKNPDAYYDVSFKNISDRGYVQQVYVDNGAFGGFGEMEYHSPAMIPAVSNEIKDRSVLWTFTGPAEALTTLSDKILASRNLF